MRPGFHINNKLNWKPNTEALNKTEKSSSGGCQKKKKKEKDNIILQYSVWKYCVSTGTLDILILLEG